MCFTPLGYKHWFESQLPFPNSGTHLFCRGIVHLEALVPPSKGRWVAVCTPRPHANLSSSHAAHKLWRLCRNNTTFVAKYRLDWTQNSPFAPRRDWPAVRRWERVWTALFSTLSVTFYVNRQVQHYDCLPGQTVGKCVPLFPYLNSCSKMVSFSLKVGRSEL